jgi:hypothetical protein
MSSTRNWRNCRYFESLDLTSSHCYADRLAQLKNPLIRICLILNILDLLSNILETFEYYSSRIHERMLTESSFRDQVNFDRCRKIVLIEVGFTVNGCNSKPLD